MTLALLTAACGGGGSKSDSQQSAAPAQATASGTPVAATGFPTDAEKAQYQQLKADFDNNILPAAKKEGDEVARYIAAGHIKAARKVVENGRFVDRDDVSDAITRVDHYPGRQALRVKSKDCLNGNVDATEVVSVEHDLAHALAVLEWVHGRFRQKDLAAGCVYFEFLIESEVPEMLHVVPLLYDAVFHLSSGAGQEMGHLGRLEELYRIADLQH